MRDRQPESEPAKQDTAKALDMTSSMLLIEIQEVMEGGGPKKALGEAMEDLAQAEKHASDHFRRLASENGANIVDMEFLSALIGRISYRSVYFSMLSQSPPPRPRIAQGSAETRRRSKGSAEP